MYARVREPTWLSLCRPLPHGRGSDPVTDPHRQLAVAKTSTDKTAIQRQIDATDEQIDQWAYELYGLTNDEIRIVEKATHNERRGTEPQA